MKEFQWFLIYSAVLFSTTGKTQDIRDFYFGEAQPKGSEEVYSDPEFVLPEGTYIHSNDSMRTVEVHSDTITAYRYMFSYFTEEDLDYKPTVSCRNGYLLGVVKGDSLPVQQSADTLYYLYPYSGHIFAPGEKHLIRPLNDTMAVLNFKEKNDNWTVLIAEFNGERIILKEVMLDLLDQEEYAVFKENEVDGDTMRIFPSKEDFVKLVMSGAFEIIGVYWREES